MLMPAENVFWGCGEVGVHTVNQCKVCSRVGGGVVECCRQERGIVSEVVVV